MPRIIRTIIILAVLVIAQVAHAEGPGKAVIATAHEKATEAGHEVLSAGGNAFDAAVAVSAALAVVEPASSGIGGGGFWLLQHADGGAVMVDGREEAPGAATGDMYLDEYGELDREEAINGPLAAGIPGAPAAWAHIAGQYGDLPLSRSLAPAIRLAEDGFAVDSKYQQLLTWRGDQIKRWPAAAEVFLDDGDVPKLGWTVRQPDLADTLRLLAREGRDGFYSGDFAARLVAGVREAGGIWSEDDLADYDIVERDPVTIDYRGYRVITASSPSSGGIAIAEILNIIRPFDLSGLDTVGRTHLLAEAMRRAYRDRALYLGDPEFVDIPTDLLLSPEYAAGLRAGIRMDRVTPSSALAGDPERTEEGTNTTHFSLIDRDGNRVSATLTVNLPYGSGFMVPGTGVLLNNEMDDFAAAPGEPNAYGLIGYAANAIEPGKRMLSSMSPTIVEGEDRLAVLGTPGGSRIITMVLLGILDFIDGNGPESWVSLPRIHHQYLPDEISIEPGALSDEQIAALEALGHAVEVRNRRWGNMHGVMWDKAADELSGASDPRWDSGSAVVR